MPKDKKTIDDRLWDSIVQIILWATLGCAGFLILFMFDTNNGRVVMRQENSWPDVIWAFCVGIIIFRFYFGNNSFVASLINDEHKSAERAFHILFVFVQLLIQLLACIFVSNVWLSVLLVSILLFSDNIWYIAGRLISQNSVQDNVVMIQNQKNNAAFGSVCLLFSLLYYFEIFVAYRNLMLIIVLALFVINLALDIYINRDRYF